MKTLFLLLILFLSGCSTIHDWTSQAGAIDIKNYDASKKLAQDLLKTWQLNSGVIRGALGEKLMEFPAGVVGAMNELDRLSKLETPTDFELGYSLGARVRMLGAIVQEALRLYSPEILKFIPSLLAL